VTRNDPEQAPGPEYPERWEADVVLRDGGTALLRPIRPEDAGLLVEFYARVSDQSKYFRFFAPYPRLSDRDVKRFTEVDHKDRVALIVTVGAEMIAVGRYDRIASTQAEVAFLVQDDHQGRGVGSVLLEHLAQGARENGIKRFIAEVLPDNRRMTGVFEEAGYQTTGGFEDGVIQLELAIEPTQTSLDVMQSREHRSEARSVERLLKPRSVAVIGASRKPEKLGQALVRNLVLGGFTGPVYAVNPNTRAVVGVPSYASLDDVPSEVDLAVVAVPADSVRQVVFDAASKGVHGLLVLSSGFAESGREGRERQRDLVRQARAYGLRVIGPNALGIINTDPDVALNASPSPIVPKRGPVGFFCQSGALGTVLVETLARRGIGVSTFVSAGNRADVSGNDVLQYWEEDDDTEVVLLYLESLGNPRKFNRISGRVSAGKPIVAVRSGQFSQGVPLGHTVHRADVPQAAFDAMFRQSGIILVEGIGEMLDVAQILAYQPLPDGSELGLVGNSDALATLAADAAAQHGVPVTRELATLGSDANAADFRAGIRDLLDDSNVDVVLAMYASPTDTVGAEIAEAIADSARDAEKPVLAAFLGREGMRPDLLGSVPSYATPQAAVRAVAKIADYVRWRRRPRGGVPAFDDIDTAAARALIEEVLASAPESAELDQARQQKLLSCYGIDLWFAHPVSTSEEAIQTAERLGWNVVLKATAPRLRQRPDLADVQRDLETPEEITMAWETLCELVGAPEEAGYVVQKTAPPGVPVYLGATGDPMFGPVVTFGVAGVATELLGDQAYRIPPLTDVDAAEMVREVRAAPLLFGHRGGEHADVAAVEELILRLSRLVYDLPEVLSAELLPVLAGRAGAAVLGAAIQIAPVEAATRTDWYARRLTRY
jgi:acyl-CoA synthetase (NDP forming)/GNAT superfamily N-acetyltransferase